jgi:hypothetical protein
MKVPAILMTLVILAAPSAQARLFQIIPPQDLIAKSKLVFVGEVRSVQSSDITTSLSYIPWEGVTFRWLVAEVEVIEPFKGTRKGEIVRTAMLSANQEVDNAPFMLSAEKGDVFLFCLLPTPITNLVAALSAPYNESLSVITLHRSRPEPAERLTSSEGMRYFNDKLLRDDKRFSSIFDLVDEKAQIVATASERFRNTFVTELSAEPSARLIYLEWETAVSTGGWRSDVPKGFTARLGSTNLSSPVYSK